MSEGVGGDEGVAPPVIPEHELLRLIAEGSYGEVWLARSATGAWRAVKVVFRERFDHERPFAREFEGIEQFEPVSRDHAGVIDILQVGRDDKAGFFYYISELADDRELGREIVAESYKPRTLRWEQQSRGRLPVEECLSIGRDLAGALGHLHERGLVHRDVKPSNVIYVNGRPRLADIGLVTGVDAARSLVGTHGFVPLEGPGQPAADIFSLGKVLYELATGEDRQAFPRIPAELREAGLPPKLRELNKLILKACAHLPGERYADAAALSADLERIERGQRLSIDEEGARWPRWAAAACVALLAGWWLWPDGATKQGDLLPRGLALHLPFNGNTDDASGNGHAIRIEWTEPAMDRHGRANQALRFGRRSRLEGPAISFKGTDARTVAFWFRVDEWNPHKPGGWLAELGDADNAQLGEGFGFAIAAMENGVIGLDGNYLGMAFKGEPFATNSWRHLVITSGDTSGSARAYLNGRPLLMATNAAFWFHPDKPWRASTDGPRGEKMVFRNFQGSLDELRVYRRALSAEEVQKLFESEKPDAPLPGSIAWDFVHSFANVNDMAADEHLVERVNLRKWMEPGKPVTYWAPDANGTGHLTWRFKFGRPARRVFLRTRLYTVDLPSGPRGAAGLLASRDGANWVALVDHLAPEPKWGRPIDFANYLPAGFAGAREVWVKAVLRAEGNLTQGVSPAQLVRAEGNGTRPVFELRARWAD